MRALSRAPPPKKTRGRSATGPSSGWRRSSPATCALVCRLFWLLRRRLTLGLRRRRRSPRIRCAAEATSSTRAQARIRSFPPRRARVVRYSRRTAMSDIERISSADASARLSDGWTYVDVRTVEEFEAGHPAGSQNVPWQLRNGNNPDFIRAMKAAFADDAKIILGCKGGVRSLKAAQALVAAGFTNVVDQRAGWDGARSPFGQVLEKGWLQLALPLEGRPGRRIAAKSAPRGRRPAFARRRSPLRLARRPRGRGRPARLPRRVLR